RENQYGIILKGLIIKTFQPSVSTARLVYTTRPSVSTARSVYATRPIYTRMDMFTYQEVWRPKGNYLDHVSKDSGSFILKKGNPEILLQDHAVVDRCCSSHMTGNKAYLSDYKDYNGGFVAFRSDPKGSKITGKALSFLMKVKLYLELLDRIECTVWLILPGQHLVLPSLVCSFMLCDLDFEPLSLSSLSLPSYDLVSLANILILCLILKASNQS
ncbi:hypothetical protein Tco_1537138, partial [Tanacetum coccineum]